MRISSSLLAFTLLVSPVVGEQIYLRNRPFKGPSAGRGVSLTVGLKEIAEAFELPVTEVNGGYTVGTNESEPTAGQVLVNGKEVSATPDAAGIQVNLKEFAEAAGLLYKPNKGLGSIDIAMGPKKPSSGEPGSTQPTMMSAGGTVSSYNKDTPGALLSVRELVPPGTVTFVYCYRDGYKDADYRSYFSKVEAAAKVADIAVVKIHVGPPGSPLSDKLNMPATSPKLLLFAKDRRCWQAYNGHGMGPILSNPQSGVDIVLARAKNPGAAPFNIP